MRYWTLAGLLMCVGTSVALAATPITPAQAIELAKAQVYAQYPEMNDPQVQILIKSTSTQVVRFVFSDPFPLNNETFWNISTRYIWYGDPEIEFAGVGSLTGPQASATPAPNVVDPRVKPQALQFLAYLSNSAPLNPGLRTAAAPVTVHMVAFFKHGTTTDLDILRAAGVDEDGRTFRANPFSRLMPLQWPPLPK